MSKAHGGEKEVGEHEHLLSISLDEQAQTAEINDISFINYIYIKFQILCRQNYQHEKLSEKYY